MPLSKPPSHSATPPAGPGASSPAGNRPPAPSLDTDLGGIFARALERQTDTLASAVGELGRRLDEAVADMRDEARATRRSLVLTITLAILVLGAALGVRTVFGGIETAPAPPPAAGPPAAP